MLICVLPATALLAFGIAQYGSIKRTQMRDQDKQDTEYEMAEPKANERKVVESEKDKTQKQGQIENVAAPKTPALQKLDVDNPFKNLY